MPVGRVCGLRSVDAVWPPPAIPSRHAPRTVQRGDLAPGVRDALDVYLGCVSSVVLDPGLRGAPSCCSDPSLTQFPSMACTSTPGGERSTQEFETHSTSILDAFPVWFLILGCVVRPSDVVVQPYPNSPPRHAQRPQEVSIHPRSSRRPRCLSWMRF